MKKNVLIDSHGWIEYFTEGPKAKKYQKFVEAANKLRYITPSIVLYEVYKRIKSTKGEDVAIKAIAQMIEHTETPSITKETALNAADISLKFKLPMADAMIKAVADENNAEVITGDPHFKGIKNVIFIK
jgi:toxin FitB